MSKRNPKNLSLGSREYSKFREVIDGECVVGTSNEDVATFPASVNATDEGETLVIAAPGANKALKIKYLMVNNATATILVVSFHEGAGGKNVFANSMPQYGSMWNANLMNCAWVLDANTALYVNLGTGGGDVNVQVGYEVVDVTSTNIALTDAETIVESQVGTHVEG
jgi:hypothetical protein